MTNWLGRNLFKIPEIKFMWSGEVTILTRVSHSLDQCNHNFIRRKTKMLLESIIPKVKKCCWNRLLQQLKMLLESIIQKNVAEMDYPPSPQNKKTKNVAGIDYYNSYKCFWN